MPDLVQEANNTIQAATITEFVIGVVILTFGIILAPFLPFVGLIVAILGALVIAF